MPGPIRKPLAHPVRTPVISDRAITLFEKARRVIRRGDEDAPELRDISYELALE